MTVAIKNMLDVENPPAGHRLCISVIAANYSLSLRDMAKATGISAAAICDVVTRNVWPIRTPRHDIESDLRNLFREHGAQPQELATLFHALVRRRPSDPTDSAVSPPVAVEEKDVLLPKQSLSPAAKKAFRLFMNPFDGEVLEDSHMFINPDISYVRDFCLQAAVASRFMAVIGESGSGKTTIQADLEARIFRDSRQVIVIKPSVLGMEDTEDNGRTVRIGDILTSIIATLDSQAPVPNALQSRSRAAQKLLAASLDAGFLHLLLIEEAHAMPEGTLKHLKRLHEMKHGRRPMLGVLLLAQPELAAKLDPHRVALREVAQRCEIVHLHPLGSDLHAYLQHRAMWADRPLSDFIDDSGVMEIGRRLTVTRPGRSGTKVQVSLLYPLAVNNLITAGLNMAAALGAPIVNADVIRAT